MMLSNDIVTNWGPPNHPTLAITWPTLCGQCPGPNDATNISSGLHSEQHYTSWWPPPHACLTGRTILNLKYTQHYDYCTIILLLETCKMGTVHDHGEWKMDEHYRAIFRIFLFQTLGQFIISLLGLCFVPVRSWGWLKRRMFLVPGKTECQISSEPRSFVWQIKRFV